MQDPQHDATRRRFEELLDARRAGDRPAGAPGARTRPTDRGGGRPRPAAAVRSFRRKV